MDMGIDLAGRWTLLLLALALSAPYVWALLAQHVNEPVFARAVKRALQAGDLARAQKLCVAVDAPLGIATRAALATLSDGSVLRRDDAEDYRSAGATIDPAAVAERLTRTFARAFDQARRAMRWRRALAASGAVAFALVVIEHARGSSAAPPAVGSTLALALLLVGANRDRTERRRALAMFEALADAMYARAMDPSGAQSPSVDAAWTLVIEQPDAPPREQPLVETVIKIGRVASAHVQLQHEAVARLHAVIEDTGESLTLIDLGGAAGTKVNGRSVQKCELRDGDQIAIGPYTLTVRGRR